MDITLFHGDCLDILPTLSADSIDSVVCDPPYGLSFMGKDWDHGVPGVPFWEAALRVAKPGAYLLAFGGTRTFHRLTVAIEDAGWEIRDCLSWLYGSGFPKGKSQLKPAWEPIVMARKPLTGTVVENVQQWGTGGINVDVCRIEGIKRSPEFRNTLGDAERNGTWNSDNTGLGKRLNGDGLGRWPANLLLDEEAAAMLDEQSGERPSGGIKLGSRQGRGVNGIYGDRGGFAGQAYAANTGGASRFFYVAKASKRDRGEENGHPTVKPTTLMQWLVRLVTPRGGVVLDCFMGSGSTGKAATLEGCRFVGIELDAEYLEIARRRIAEAERLAAMPVQTELEIDDD